MATSYYSTGTITLTNGSAVVTGTGTAWQTVLITGGNIFVQAQGNPLPIASVDSDTQITAELEWTGASGTYEYRIQLGESLQANSRNMQNLVYLLSELRQGTLFKYDAAGTLADRDLFDAKPKGYSYLVFSGDSADLYVKNSNTSGDWAGPFAYGTGPQGIQGPIGTLNPMGAYSAGTTYAANDNVLYNGSSWVALQATTGNAPPVLPTTENAYWSLVAAKGQDGLGTGDVVGPAAAVNNRLAVFDGATGKLLKDGGKTLDDYLLTSGGTMTGPIENAAFAAPGANTKRAHFDLTGVTAGQDRAIIVPDTAGLALSKWETIGDYALAAAVSLDITGLSSFRKIRATGHLYGSALAAINLVTSTNNGGTWDTGASDYNAQIMQVQGATFTGFSGNAAFIGISGGVPVSGNADDGLLFEFSIDNFNKASRMKYVSKCFFIGAAGNYASTIGAQRLQATARNAFRIIAASGALSGTVLVEGVRG